MPAAFPSDFALLMKSDRRKQWKMLKEKHAKAITKSKLDFDQKLGPALDKYQSQVEKITQQSAKTEITATMLQPMFECCTALQKIVTAYHGTIKALEDPAKKEMTALLMAIEGDIHSWTELILNTTNAVSKGSTAAEKAAAGEVMVFLETIYTLCVRIVGRGPRAKAAYEKTGTSALAVSLVSHYAESARLAGPAAHETSNAAAQVMKGSNYELFKARAKTAAVLIHNVHQAANAFHANWDHNLAPEIRTATADADARALNETVAAVDEYFGGVLPLIDKLP